MNLSLDTRKPSGATDQVKICVSETLVNSFYPQRGEAKQLLFKNQDTRLRLENLIPLYSDEEIEGYWLLHLGAEAQIRKSVSEISAIGEDLEEFRSNKNDAYSGTISVAATFKAEKEQDLNKGQSPSASVNRDRDTLRTMDSTEEPTTVLIDDEPLDINGTGIDVEYLEDPPPDNFREEIVRQHVHNQPEPNPEALERIRKIGQKRPLSHTTEPQGSSGKKRKIDVSETKDVLYQKQSVESWRCFK